MAPKPIPSRTHRAGEPATGLEPVTFALQERCATNCARPADQAERPSRQTILEGCASHLASAYFVGVVVGVTLGVGVVVEYVSPCACTTNARKSSGFVSDPLYC